MQNLQSLGALNNRMGRINGGVSNEYDSTQIVEAMYISIIYFTFSFTSQEEL